jgi:hypothetical protein
MRWRHKRNGGCSGEQRRDREGDWITDSAMRPITLVDYDRRGPKDATVGF